MRLPLRTLGLVLVLLAASAGMPVRSHAQLRSRLIATIPFTTPTLQRGAAPTLRIRAVVHEATPSVLIEVVSTSGQQVVTSIAGTQRFVRTVRAFLADTSTLEPDEDRLTEATLGAGSEVADGGEENLGHGTFALHLTRARGPRGPQTSRVFYRLTSRPIESTLSPRELVQLVTALDSAVATAQRYAAQTGSESSSGSSTAATRTGGHETDDAPRPTDAQERPYFEFQVEKPVVAVAGSCRPDYPERLRRTGVTGEVQAQFVVDTLGRAELRSFKVLKSTHDAFTEAVRVALTCMRFLPAETGGRRVRQLLQQPFNFDLAR